MDPVSETKRQHNTVAQPNVLEVRAGLIFVKWPDRERLAPMTSSMDIIGPTIEVLYVHPLGTSDFVVATDPGMESLILVCETGPAGKRGP